MDYTASTAASTALSPAPAPASIDDPKKASARWGRRADLAVILPLLALVLAWTLIYPQSGDGDSPLHYLNARNSYAYPELLLGSWARIGIKIFMVLPARFGLFPTRCVWLGITGLLAWQTIGLARDLNLRRPRLAALLLIAQPFVFALASDTMTELPMALGLVVALRLWGSRRWWISCLVIGYLPTVRPEGFFFGVMWGLMVLATPAIGPLVRRMVMASTLAWGTAAWCVVCGLIRGDFLFILGHHGGWNWTADSSQMYGIGRFFHYIDWWPIICGPVILALFLAALSGLRHRWAIGIGIGTLLVLQVLAPSDFREKVLPYPALALIAWLAWDWRKEKIAPAWWALLLVATLHTVLWWRGWFASCGLLRIMAVVSPAIAVVALRGWNAIEQRFHPARWMGIATVAAAMVYAMGAYALVPSRQRIFGIHETGNYVRQHHLMDHPAELPAMVFGDEMGQIDLNLPPNSKNLLLPQFTHAQTCRLLLDAPLGTVGLWDNQHGWDWYHVDPSEFPTMGYTILYTAQRPVWPPWRIVIGPRHGGESQIFIVIRKDRQGTMPPEPLWP